MCKYLSLDFFWGGQHISGIYIYIDTVIFLTFRLFRQLYLYLNCVIFCRLLLLYLKMDPGGLKLVAAIKILQSKILFEIRFCASFYLLVFRQPLATIQSDFFMLLCFYHFYSNPLFLVLSKQTSFNPLRLSEGFKNIFKKIMENSIKRSGPPSYLWKKVKYFFLKHNMRNFSLDMVLSPKYVSTKPRGGGLRSPKGGPPIHEKCLKMIFRPFGAKNKKLDMENDPSWPPS